ncbi:ABC transporter substrate-binding protein [Glutamicibacter sp.]|uniref:ABC transporter substrate-binding protein n=1 Tax=Glutamicibacter sp. TaxID=1931995 RepID=UPI0028BECC55|nr:ABC transporter substrate-binding protein [Glutamicibacter sp.]
MRTKLATVAVVASAALALTACGGSANQAKNADGPKYEITDQTAAASGELDQVTWATYAEPMSLDYAYAFDYADNQVLSNVCESLLRLNPDLSVSPGLATEWKNTSPTTWVFTIRDGVTFHDGGTMTADDVVASMSRHMDPAVGSFWYSVYQNVKSIKKTGDNEVTVTTKIPDALFAESMSGAAGVVESAKTLKKVGRDYGNAKGGVNCTGPFAFGKWQSGEKISLTRYDNYWDKDLKAKTKNLDFVIMTDPVARVNAMKSGEVDGSWLVPANAIDELKGSGSGQMYFGPNSATQMLVVSNLEGPLGKPEVRKALLMAIDRNGLAQAATMGYGKPTNSFTNESVWAQADEATAKEAFENLQDYPYDLDAATKIIEEQGVKGQEITITTAPMGNDFAVVAQATAAAAESIGLKAKINTVTPNAYSALFSDPEARKGTDLYFTSWYLSIGDPLEMFSILRTGDFSNYGNWSDKAFDANTNAALETMDQQERFKKSLTSQKITNEQIPWLPLYETPNYLWMSDKVSGPSPSVNFLYYPWAAQLGAK